MRIDWTLLHDDLEAAASLYARASLAVFPLAEGGKRPLTGHGFKDATTDRQQIARWWSRWPRANVGLRIPPDVVVIDFDSQEAFDRLTTGEFGLPTTVAASTGRGRHLWYRTTGQTISRKIGLFEDVDILVRGYLVAPPSIHGTTGKRYRWIVPPDCDAVAPCPEWLLERLSRNETPAQRSLKASRTTDWPEVLGSSIGEGRRNQTLAQVAGLLFRRLPAAVAVELAYCWARIRMVPPLPEAEILRTLDSIAACELRRRGGLA